MKISVCMATYNGESYIKEQIESILPQLGDDDEVVISDDGSTDDTISIIESFDDCRINLIHHTNNHGYTKNFEHALLNATGDYFFLSDQDDVWAQNKVSIMLRELKHNNLVMSDAVIVDKDLKLIHDSHFKKANVRQGFLINFAKTRYVGACMAFDKKLYDAALPFPKNQKLCVHDYWLTLLGELYFKTKLLKTPLIKYRRHDNNLTGEKSTRNLQVRLLTRVYTAVCLTARGVRL